MMAFRLDALTTFELREAFAKGACIALLPVGSVEPHGPHLPLATDSVISEEAATRATAILRSHGLFTFVAPTIPFGVTDYAEGFAGAVTVSAEALTGFVGAVVDGLLATGFSHVCVINNHLEPAQDRAIRAVQEGREPKRVSVACPLTRRWGRTLNAEFKSGACHAGEYETSLVLAARGHGERATVKPYALLKSLDLSLSKSIAEGKATFEEIGMTEAYTGDPANASIAIGDDQYEKLAQMIVTEVEEAIAAAS